MSNQPLKPDPGKEEIFVRLNELIPRLVSVINKVTDAVGNANLAKMLAYGRTLADDEDMHSLLAKMDSPIDLMQILLGIMQSIQSGDILLEDVDDFEKDIASIERLFDVPSKLYDGWAAALKDVDFDNPES